MIKTTAILLNELSYYASPADKLTRLTRENACIRVTNGLYETDNTTPGHLLAGSIYGPSYLSFEYALAHHGLIPEAVYTFTCATFMKHKKKSYTNAFGTFTYRDVPAAAFPYGVDTFLEGDYSYKLATPEKALCDKLYTLAPVANYSELEALLFEDIRVDETAFINLDCENITFLADLYGSTSVKKLAGYIRRFQ